MFNTFVEPNRNENVTYSQFQSMKLKNELFQNHLVDMVVPPISDKRHLDEPNDNVGDENSKNVYNHVKTADSEKIDASEVDDDSGNENFPRDLKLNKTKKVLRSAYKKKIKTKVKRNRKCSGAKTPFLASKKPKCEYPRVCSGCGHAYKTKQSFWNHKQRCPLLPQNIKPKVDENGVPVDGVANGDFIHRKEYICAHCERRYRKKYNLRQHLKNTCRGKLCTKGRLQCWEAGCLQAFYKYVDLVQHVTIQHGQDLQIQKLQFPNFSAFNMWKTEESNSKFMYARKITGSKHFSNTKYHYFVCQFNHRNEKKNSNRKTNRRKKDSLVVPNYNCPSRIMVKECENQIFVTYISSHNHELNLSNVKYQPLEKETRAYIKTLLQLGVTPKKIIDHLRTGVGQPEIDSFLTTKQHFLTLNRIKRMESKLRAKDRARQTQLEKEEKIKTMNACDNDTFVPEDSFPSCEVIVNASTSTTSPMALSYSSHAEALRPTVERNESDEVIRSIENNLKKLKSYMHKNSIKERLSDRISKMIQELCDECENMDNSTANGTTAVPKKMRVSNSNRKQKMSTPLTKAVMPPPTTVSIGVPAVAVSATLATTLPMQQHHVQVMQPVIIQQQQPIQTHQLHHQSINSLSQVRIVNAVVNSIISNDLTVPREKTFSPVINETTDLLKPIFQPFNVNLLSLKSIDKYIPDHEQLLLKRVDDSFAIGWLYDAIVNSFLNLICRSLANVLTADNSVTEYVQIHQKVPDIWHCFNWGEIDTIFIPCNPSKRQWILMVVLVKQLEVQILDPTGACYEEAILNIYKKHESTIHCWYEVLRNFLGIAQWNVTSPPHTKHPDLANSGVLVCWYVLQYINKRSLIDSVDPDIMFRQFIFNTIVNSGSAT